MDDKAKSTIEQEITTERLCLLSIVDSDVSDIFAFMSNPNTTHSMSSLKPHKNVKDTEILINSLRKSGINSHLWAIRIKNTYRVIGFVQFFLLEINKAEIHYILAEEFWNRGLMTEAICSVLSWAYNIYPQLKTVGSHATETNIASCKVLEKCNFQIVNRRCVRSQRNYPLFVNMIYYELNLD